MTIASLLGLLTILIFLVFISGFFSAAETAIMAINRYRLRHLARGKNKAAIRVTQLLERPDRLLGVILIGNNVANIFASSLATFIALHLWGDIGVVVVTVLLTLIILIFAEVMPKTLAASYSQPIAFWVSLPLKLLLKLFYPLVWFMNTIVNGTLKLFRTKLKSSALEHLSSAELTTLLKEAGGNIPATHQDMLLAVLELEQIEVNDIMIPRHNIFGIDLDNEWSVILSQLSHSRHTRIPIYSGTIDNIQGILHLRSILALIEENKLSKEAILAAAMEPYFIPENTPLYVQLLNFRKINRRTAIVVDEYGDIQGLVTLEDILEEIVGDFSTLTLGHKMLEQQADGSYIVEGSVTLRELNRILNLGFSIAGPKTLSGLIIEELEAIPQVGACIKVSNHTIEVMKVKNNRVQQVRIVI